MSLDKTTLLDSFEKKGKWWLASKPGKKIPGILYFKGRDSITIELDGHLTLKNNSFDISGLTQDGFKVRVVNCFESQRQLSMMGGGNSKITGNLLILGDWDRLTKNKKFLKCDINYSHLEEWMGINPLRSYAKGNKTGTIKPKTISIKIPSQNATVETSYRWNKKHESNTIKYSYSNDFRVTPKKGKPLNWFLDFQHHMQMLIAVLVGGPVQVKQIRMYDGDKFNKFHVFYILNTNEIKEKISFHEMLFPLKKIKKKFPVLLRNWFEKMEDIRPVAVLFSGVINRLLSNLEPQFLAYTQAIEAFHARFMGGTYLSEADYRKVSQVLKSSIPKGVLPDLVVSLKSRIKYGNEFSLRKRLKDIFQNFSQKTNNLITKDTGKFSNKVVNARNYFTHYSKELEKGSLRKRDLYFAIQKLRLILIFLFAKEIGLKEDQVRNAVRSNGFYKWVLEGGKDI